MWQLLLNKEKRGSTDACPILLGVSKQVETNMQGVRFGAFILHDSKQSLLSFFSLGVHHLNKELTKA